MGRKVFVSYKYWDSSVLALPGVGYTIVRDYVDYIEKNLLKNDIYKGESNDEDLSFYSDDYIWSKLNDKIYDSSVTIVLISPNMKESNKWQKSQWIPWEISFSLRLTTRKDRTSQRNAILGVILPNEKGSYDYYNAENLFPILKDNIKNNYICVVKWNEFLTDPDLYLLMASYYKSQVPDNKLCIEL